MKLFSMLTLSLALASTNALAADPPKPTTKPAATMPPMDHSKMDHGKMTKMGDGKMSMDHGKMADGAFAALDKNGDGSLAKSEIPSQHPLTMHFQMLDTNKDGRLSKGEFAASHKMP